MALPQTNYHPPFNVTRASHIVLTVSDLDNSKAHYVDMLGMILTERTADALYLRGIDERAHHSVVLRKSDSAGTVDRIGVQADAKSRTVKIKFLINNQDRKLRSGEVCTIQF